MRVKLENCETGSQLANAIQAAADKAWSLEILALELADTMPAYGLAAYKGGNHVAVITPGQNKRIALITEE